MDPRQARYIERSKVRQQSLAGAAAAALTGRSRTCDILNVASLLKSRDPLTRQGAIKNLVTMGGPQAMHAIARALYDANPKVRITACKALGNMRAHPAKSQLLDTLNDRDPVVTCAAAEALCTMGDKAGLLHVARMVRSQSTHTWRALRILNQLTNSHFSIDDAGLAHARSWIKQNGRRFARG